MLQTRHPVDSTFNVNSKHIVIELIQAKSKFFLNLNTELLIPFQQSSSHLFNKDWVNFITSYLKSIPLKLQVD